MKLAGGTNEKNNFSIFNDFNMYFYVLVYFVWRFVFWKSKKGRRKGEKRTRGSIKTTRRACIRVAGTDGKIGTANNKLKYYVDK